MTADARGAKPKKILVVEDSELLHQMFDLLLLRYRVDGCQVLHAYDGRQALAELSEHPDCDIVFLDLVMPVMTGLEFLEHRRSSGLHRDVPVVIVTTKGSEDDVRRGLQAGAASYITKPINSQNFYSVIEWVMSSKSR